MGWATVLVGGGGAIALLCVALFLLLMGSWNRSIRLGPPRVRGLSEAEAPRYLELITEPARRRFEDLGFRRAGYLATKPIGQTDPEIVSLVMRNDETRTVAYLHARYPFTAARPSTVSFESFLPDGSVFGTRGRFVFIVGPALPNRRRSAASADEGVYRDHLAGLARWGLQTMELPATFEGLVALNVTDAANIWQTRLDLRVVVRSREGDFRYSRWHSLACVPNLVFLQLRMALNEARRCRSAPAQGSTVDASAPEIQQFLAERARYKKELTEAARNKFKMSRSRTVMLWIAMVIGFTFMWQFLNHRPR